LRATSHSARVTTFGCSNVVSVISSSPFDLHPALLLR
jgi:hypothetical protein